MTMPPPKPLSPPPDPFTFFAQAAGFFETVRAVDQQIRSDLKEFGIPCLVPSPDEVKEILKKSMRNTP